MTTSDLLARITTSLVKLVQATINKMRDAHVTGEWGANVIIRTGWAVRYENGERVYVHDTGWKVKDFCGPNEGIAVQTAGPDKGRVLENPGGRLFFSALQAMLFVEKFLRGET